MPFSSSAGADSVHSKRHDLRRNSYHTICCMMRVLGQTETVTGRMHHFSHTTPYQQHFTSNTVASAQEHFSPHHRRCAHHTQESANMLPTLCRICSVTELSVCRMHVQTLCIIREYTLQITTVVAPIFFVFVRVSVVSIVATIYRNLPDVS